MNWQIYFWAIIGVIFLTIVGIGYLFTATTYGPKLAIKSSVRYLAFIILFSIIYYVVFLLIPASYEDFFWIFFYLALSIVLLVILFAQIQGKRKIATEKMLLDLGLDNNGFWLILMGLFFILTSISLIRDGMVKAPFTALDLSHITFSFLAGILGLYKGISKTVITDEGIFSLAGYVKWSSIKSYKWEESKLPILKLKVEGFWFSLNRASIHVPEMHKNTVQDLLSRKLLKAENV